MWNTLVSTESRTTFGRLSEAAARSCRRRRRQIDRLLQSRQPTWTLMPRRLTRPPQGRPWNREPVGPRPRRRRLARHRHGPLCYRRPPPRLARLRQGRQKRPSRMLGPPPASCPSMRIRQVTGRGYARQRQQRTSRRKEPRRTAEAEDRRPPVQSRTAGGRECPQTMSPTALCPQFRRSRRVPRSRLQPGCPGTSFTARRRKLQDRGMLRRLRLRSLRRHQPPRRRRRLRLRSLRRLHRRQR